MTTDHPRLRHLILAAATVVLSSADLAAQTSDTPSRVKQAAEPTVPSLDSLRVLIARELPTVAKRPADSPPVLAVFLANRDGSILASKTLPLVTERVSPLEVLEKEFSLKPNSVYVALVGIVDGPKEISKGSLWVVWGKVE